MRRSSWWGPAILLVVALSPRAGYAAELPPCPQCETVIRAVVDELQARGWWGAALSVCDADMPGISASGLLVMEVVPGGPAAEAGLEKHDILVAIDGTDLVSLDEEEIEALVAAIRPGDRLALEIEREGRRSELEVRAIRMPYLELARMVGERLVHRYAPRSPQIVGSPPPGWEPPE